MRLNTKHMKKILHTGLCLLALNGLHAQNVTTLYDFGTENITDDIIFDEAGNLYGADYDGTNIYKVTPAGEVSIFAGGFQAPNGLAFDSAGNLFMCDNTGDAIYKMDSDGNILDSWDVASPSGLIKEHDSDTLIFTTYLGHTIQKLAPDGVMIPMFSGGELNGPVGLTYDGDNNLYIANFTDRKIFRVDGDELVQIIQLPGGGSLGFIAFAMDHIFATAFTRDKIYKVNPFFQDSITAVYGGAPGTVTLDGPVESARYDSPNGIRTNAGGDTLFISQFNDGVIRVITELTLSLNEEKNPVEFEIYPNPSMGEINLTSDKQIESVRIMDVQGRKVFEISKGNHAELTRFETGLKPGIYFVQVTDKNGEQGLRKWVAE